MASHQTFAQALSKASDGLKKPHLLLGNGFSRACKDDIFAYDALFDRADFRDLSQFCRQAFESLKTTDFEVVMRALRMAVQLVRLYAPDQPKLAEQFQQDAEGLREVLVRTIAEHHPGVPAEIPAAKYAGCRRFLGNFDRLFTINYDLLLYWALMQRELEPNIPCDDGFRKPPDDATYVTWEPENTYTQNVYYLHGGLHLFDAGSELQKYTWSNTGIPLIQQIRAALNSDLYPLFVAEGTSVQKVDRIRHHAYLSKAERSLNNIAGSLFAYGLSLASNDEHILKAVLNSKVSTLYVSLFGDPTSVSNQRIISTAEDLIDQRPKRKPLKIEFYDAQSAAVWG